MDPSANALDAPLTSLKGVGPALAERLAKISIHRVGDALFHLPLRYQDRHRVKPIRDMQHGDEVLCCAEVVEHSISYAGRRSLRVRVSDDSGTLELRFFYFHSALLARFATGSTVFVFGEVRKGPRGTAMFHPEVLDEAPSQREGASQYTPTYPSSEGLTQLQLRKVISQCLERLAAPGARHSRALTEWIPASLLPEPVREWSLIDALQRLHHPPLDVPLQSLLEGRDPATQRLAFEELLAHRLGIRASRAESVQQAAPAMRRSALSEQLLAQLGFTLTGAQARVLTELETDLAQELPMYRLLQGDVGSGKTAVAALCAAVAVAAGWQVAVMAPTELLAEQHYANFQRWFAPLDIEVGWLGGKASAKERRLRYAHIGAGAYAIVCGTHALFQSDVRFHKLGLCIIDEQHRFGVAQRMALLEKAPEGLHPHQLTMTATPIPRTLAMTAYADLDLSVIDELPPGRTPVETVVLAESKRDDLIARIAGVLDSGQQCYWVCTLITESETLQASTAEDTYASLCAALPQHNVGLVHGKLSALEKAQAMSGFADGDTQLLVATTVIEVGVDVPNASLMVIENAERLGLSQLHQLRGRVGRGAAQSRCVLLYQPPLGNTSRARLDTIRQNTDGFVIAERDLELRGPGELLGTRQTGDLHYRIADLIRDRGLLDAVQDVADQWQDKPAEDALIQRWLGARSAEFSRV